MSTVTVTINTDNAAFREHGRAVGAVEVARILRDTADEIEGSALLPDSARLRDINGNTIGEWRISDDPR